MTTRVPGLKYVTDEMPGIRRRRAGRGFVYLRPGGRRVERPAELDRIRAIAIPPAWTDVWICALPDGHLLATGRDQKGRKQYRYHPRWRSVRDEAKFDRLIPFGEGLPALRRRVRRDMRLSDLPKEKVVATLVALLDHCFARIGNEEYAKSNGSFGLTTLRSRHVRIESGELRLRYRGKGGKEHEARIDDPAIVRVVRRCEAIPGQELFRYVNGSGKPLPIGSADVNDYLREITGEDVTAKDFRTWGASVSAASLLTHAELPESERAQQQVVADILDEVAAELGNTRSICRKCYVHPALIEGYADGSLHRAYARAPATTTRGLSAAERFLLKYLRGSARHAPRAKRAA